MATETFLGFRAHSGWAALVALAGSPRGPQVVARERIEMVDGKSLGAAQPYHEAEGRTLAAAEKMLERFRRSAQALAVFELGAVLDELRRRGHAPVGCGILLSSGHLGADLARTLASHALIHTADGEHFRAALRHAAEHHGLRIAGVREKELIVHATKVLRRSEEDLRRYVAEMGKPVGRPWKQDQKLAALLAWTLLAESDRR